MSKALRCVLAVLMCATVLAACSGEEPTQATSGVAIGSREKVLGNEMYVSVPAGRITFTATPFQTSLNDVYVSEVLPEDRVVPPEGGGFIGINWDTYWRPNGRLGNFVHELEPTTFTLVADKDRYPVKSPVKVVQGTGSGAARTDDHLKSQPTETVVIPIARKPKNVSMEVAYDGVTQSIDLVTGKRTPGLAAGMYEATAINDSFPQESCGSSKPSGGYPRLEWDALECYFQPNTGLVPYTSERGWAPEGKRWAIVTVKSTFQYKFLWNFTGDDWPRDRRSAEYRTVDFRSDDRLNGAKPLSTVLGDVPDYETAHVMTYTWLVNADDALVLDVNQTYSSDNPDGHDPALPPYVKATLDKEVKLTF